MSDTEPEFWTILKAQPNKTLGVFDDRLIDELIKTVYSGLVKEILSSNSSKLPASNEPSYRKFSKRTKWL